MAFVERYILNTCANNSGKAIKLVLLKNQDTTPTPINIGGTSAPIKIRYKDDGENPLNYVIGSECELNLVSSTGFTAEDLYTENEKDWRADVYIENVLYWRGYFLPDGISQPYSDENYDIRIIATDGLGKTKDIPYSDGGILYRGFDTQKNILVKCLATLGISLDISIFTNTKETHMDAFSSPLNQLSINQDRFIDVSNNPLSVFDVLESILITYSARLFQCRGNWVLETILEKDGFTLNGYKYSSSGTLIGTTSQTQNLSAGGVDQQMTILNQSHVLTTENALKDTTAYYQYGFIRNSLSNGNFDTLDGAGFFLNWSRVDPSIAVVEDTYVYDSDGNPILAGHRLFVIENNIISGDAVSSEDINVRKNEKVTISFNASTGIYSLDEDAVLHFKIVDDDGLFFTGSDGWKTSGTLDVTTKSSDFKDDAVITFYIDIPARDHDYVFSFSFGAWVDGFFGDIFSYFDNFNVTVDVNQLLKPPIGSYVTKTQYNTFTTHGDTKVMIFGDDSNDLTTSQMLVGSTPTTLWKRLYDATFAPILSIVADTDLKLNGRPKLLFDAEFFTEETISMQTMVSVQFLSTKFIILTGEFDIINEEYHLRLIELLSAEIGNETFYGVDTGNFKNNKGSTIGQIGGVSLPSGSGTTGGNFVTKWQEWESTFKAKSYILPTEYETDPSFDGWQIYVNETGGGSGGIPPVYTASMATLTDVLLTSLTNNQTLKWDSSISKWVNTSSSGGGSIATLTDVTLTSLADKQLLQWDSTASKWKNVNGQGYSFGDYVGRISGGGVSFNSGVTVSIYTNSNRDLILSANSSFGTETGGVVLKTHGIDRLIADVNGDIIIPNLDTGVTAPTTTGTIKNVIVDADGKLSWNDGGGSIASLSDVTLTSIANNNLLKYDSATSKWVNTLTIVLQNIKATNKLEIPEKSSGTPTGNVWEIYVAI